MVRVKRIKTREEAEAENKRAIGVPEGPEDHASKKRRLSGLSSRKFKLNKELRALLACESEHGTVGADAAVSVQHTNRSEAERQRLHRERLSAEELGLERQRDK
ncbi:hypothetical protein DVH05_009589 [Phytophthora capsici]|nr:hypothetical protein DVH05_002935 [Phytophthora capsici]KAG1702641.1 hypothetical protein DVH05_009589 [Phytophthora capsici]